MRFVGCFLVLSCLDGIGTAADTKAAVPEDIQRAFTRLYNFDFPETRTVLARHIAGHPADPLGYAVRSAACLFLELHRLGILESEFLTDDRRIISKKKLKPDPGVKSELWKAVADAQERARQRLSQNPGDREALFSLCLVTGVLTDYTALVEKRQFGSLSYARQSQVHAVRLLRLDPTFYDAYLTSGVNEYLVGSMPFFLRWFVRFEQVQGSKKAAIGNLELVARSGRYLGPFAKILLAIIHLREKRPQESERLLRELTQEFPENPLLRQELARLAAQNSRGAR